MKYPAVLSLRWIKPKRFTTLVMMLIIWTSVASALFAGISTDMRARAYLEGRSQTIANALPGEKIADLTGTDRDIKNTAYIELKQRLAQIKEANSDLSFVYILGQRDTNVFFYVDSADSNSPDYSAPGEAYPEASNRLKGSFTSSKTIIEGPSRDSYGIWMSALTPIVDPKTRQTIAVVGIDTPATAYFSQIALYALVPLLLAAIPVAGLIRDMKLRAKEAELLQLKSQFVSIASHELRSPLAGILWAIQTLSKSGATRLNLEQLSMLGDMYHSVESSLSTVNEILDFSIFERGHQHSMQHEFVDVRTVIRQVITTLKLSAHEKRIIIQPVGDWPRDLYTRGDVSALKRAFMNVISNAIKYSPDKGVIDITYRTKGAMHIIGIQDHGIGIPDDEQEKVLGGYYRATNAAALEVHGTGLGLWVTNKIIEEHTGRMWLESKVGTGTTIHLALPIALPPKPVLVTKSSADLLA